MPKRPLITEATVVDAARAGRRTLDVPPGALVTALARDAAREKNVALVDSNAPASGPAAATAPATASPATPVVAVPPVAPKTVALGSDHGGFEMKAALAAFVPTLGFAVLDVGTDSEAAVDYPDFAYAVARAVALGQARFGVMIDGAGIGSCMVANKVAGIRAACCWNEFTAFNARAHNDAHVLTLGSRALGLESAKFVVRTFLATPFEGGRHAARVAKIDDVERAARG